MKIETMLPLGKLDPGLREAVVPLDIAAVAEDARHAEELGYDGVLAAETKDPNFSSRYRPKNWTNGSRRRMRNRPCGCCWTHTR